MRQSKREGFSLVEVLVSLLVVMVGVIGAVGMQMSALRTSRESGYQTLAVQLASEMAERIRMNGTSSLFVDYRSADSGPVAVELCYAEACSAEELLAFDLYEWVMRIREGLPAGRARICRDAAPWDAVEGAFKWDCDEQAGASMVIKLGWQARNPDGSLPGGTGNAFPPGVILVAEAKE